MQCSNWYAEGNIGKKRSSGECAHVQIIETNSSKKVYRYRGIQTSVQCVWGANEKFRIVVSDTYGWLLCPILLWMLPDDHAFEFTRKMNPDHEWKALNFMNWEVESRECAMQLVNAWPINKEAWTSHKQNCKWDAQIETKFRRVKMPAATALHMGSLNTPLSCIFCVCTKHKSKLCTDDDTVSTQREKLKV